MLGIGLKQSDTPLPGLRRPLQEFILREYASDIAGSAEGAAPIATALTPPQQDAVDKFFQLKTDVDLVRTPSSISRHVLLRYFAQLDCFVARFPCEAAATGVSATTAASSGPAALRLQFTWNDSFCPRKKITQSSVRFEQAAVMFNYGALESQLGVQTDRSSADGLKAACKHFMLAAGAFARVKDELVDQCLGARTPDTSAEGLGLLTYLMLAQAQACFYEKAIKDQMKDGIKAKLAHQALEYYLTALDFSNSPALAGTIDRTWAIHVAFQVHCMKAATQYWQAKASKEVALTRGTGYGEEIARLQAADDECHTGIKMANTNKLPASLIESVRALQRVVREHLQTAQKDNASVYLENVPKVADLPAIGKASMVRPLSVTSDELTTELGSDLFDQFVPKSILQRAASEKDAIKQLLAVTTERVSETNDAAKSKLNALGLPASIEAFEQTSDNGIPLTIWHRIQHIQTTNQIFVRAEMGVNDDPQHNTVSAFLQHRLKENQHAADRAEKRLHAIEAQLSAEEIDDNVCRQNYSAKRWSRPASSALNENFRADIDRYYRLVQEAKKSDDIVRDKLVANAPLLVLLAQTKASLDRQLPLLQSDNSSCRNEIETLSTLLLQLGRAIDEKDQVVRDFSASFDKLNVLPILLSSNTKDAAATNAALATERQFFQTHFVDKIATICDEEQALLMRIDDANAQFDAKKASDAVIHARQAFLQRLSDAVDVFEQLESHVKEGSTFYAELQARIDQLHQTVADHCAARDIEKRELELNIASDDEMRQNEAKDAALAQQMMANMQLRDASAGATQSSSDEAFARQMAGGTPQYYPSPPQQQQQQQQQQQAPPSYDFARAQAQQSQSQQQQQQPNGHGSMPYSHPYSYYQQAASSNSSAPPPPPAYAGYAPSQQQQQPPQGQMNNFYNQQHQQYQHLQQGQQNPQQGGYGYYQQYPAYQQQGYGTGNTGNSPPSAPSGNSI